MKQKTDILFIISKVSIGGAGKMIKAVANLCAEHYDNVALLSFAKEGRPDDLSDKVTLYSLDDSCKGGLLWRLNLIIKLRKTIANIAPCAVCSFISDICVTTRVATLGMKCKVASAERMDPYTMGPIWKILVKWAYDKSDYCFFQLEQARDYFGRKIIKKSFVIPNTFEQDADVTPYYGVRNKTIVSAGRFVAQKDYVTLIEAFAKVHDSYPEYKLIIYGEGPSLQQYESLVHDLNIENSVSFPGYVHGVAKAIREDGIFVLSSQYEGIPNSLIEALSIAIPCVSTDCTPGGPYFLTKGGANGLLVPIKDKEALANAIIRLIENPDLASTLSQRGPSILRELDTEKITALWISAFDTILKTK